MRIYLSHPIRGTKEQTIEYLFENLLKACNMADKMREFGVSVYCPAEHEEFVQLAYDSGLLTVEQILEIDKKIIDRCDAVIFYDHENKFSPGMLEEAAHCEKTGKPSAVLVDFSTRLERVIDHLRNSCSRVTRPENEVGNAEKAPERGE